jgi:hypothetical protein
MKNNMEKNKLFDYPVYSGNAIEKKTITSCITEDKSSIQESHESSIKKSLEYDEG